MAVNTMSAPRPAALDGHPEKRVTLAFLVTGLAALLVGALLGPLPAMNYAGIDRYQYLPFLRSYYQGLTLHGVLNALVFTTFFISGMLLYLPARELGMRPNPALASAWFWFVGMMVFALGMHCQGLLAVPRPAFISRMADPAGTPYAEAAVPLMITEVSGVILLVAVILYFTVLFGTLLGSRTLPEAPPIPFAEAVEYRSEGIMKVLDSLWAWFALAVLLVLLAYLPTLIDQFLNQVPVPGMRPW
jgi:heme/copper-type cytochrome/quinol oxidase subunit 1